MSSQLLRPWKTLERKLVLNHGPFLKVENHMVQLPEGRVITDWPWVIIPSAVIVLAQTMEGKFLCFRQIKYAVEGLTLAPVGGMIEEGEDPLDAAKRELLEETGYQAAEWKSFGSYLLDPNRGIATDHLFLARRAVKVAEPDSDDLEDQELLLLEREELACALAAGDFKVVAWTAVVALALMDLDR